MTRIEALQLLTQQPHYRKLAFRLSEAEFDAIIEFAEEQEHLAHLEFEYAVNRMFLDGRRDHLVRPKFQSVATELLVSANTKAKGEKR